MTKDKDRPDDSPSPRHPDRSDPGKDDKSPNHGFNFILIATLLSVAIGLSLWYAIRLQTHELAYSRLTALIESTKFDENGEVSGHVDVEETPGVTVRYSNLRRVVVGGQRVRGIVRREVLTPKNGDARVNVNERYAFHTNLSGQDSLGKELRGHLEAHGLQLRYEDPPSIFQNWVPLFLLTSFFIFGCYLLLRKIGGAGSPMAFGRSRGKLYAQEDLGVTFDDVAGIEEAVEEVREVVDFLRSPDKYQTLGGRIPKGVLLVGPPGTGKTLLAKAIAGEAGTPFYSLSGSDFVEMFVGVGAARVRDMFEQAVAKAPCIIFIDELDALGKTRGTSMVGGHDEREQTLNALLVEMDGFDANAGVIVMAATNRPEMLDPALLRPGRFDRQVLVDRPDIAGRQQILNVHIKNVKLDDDVDVASVAKITPGFAGADLANLVNEAALLAARNNKLAVGMQEFNDGVERVTAGLEKKQRVMNAEEKNRVAYHEAGHAIVAFLLPNTDPVHKVSIIPRGMAALGYTMQRPEGDRFLLTQSELESRIQVLLAGTVTEEIIYQDISTGAQNDLERATEIARSMVMDYGMSRLGRINFRESSRSPFLAGGGEERVHGFSESTAREIDDEVKRILDDCLMRVREILLSRKDALIALAEELISVESIDGVELKRVVEENSPGPQVVPGTGVKPRVAPAPNHLAEESGSSEMSG